MPAGAVVGRGFHRARGEAHAEAVALARGRGARARRHAVRDARAVRAPWPHAAVRRRRARIRRAARGRLRTSIPTRAPRVRASAGCARAGVEVEWGVLDREAIELNLRFVVSKLLARPEVTLKWAMSLDGKIATASGESRWISSPAGRRWALGLREEHDALLVGSGTVLADDPSLDRRVGWAKAPNTRVVLDRRLRVGPGARLFEIPGPVLLYTESERRGAAPSVGRARRRSGRARDGDSARRARRSASPRRPERSGRRRGRGARRVPRGRPVRSRRGVLRAATDRRRGRARAAARRRGRRARRRAASRVGARRAAGRRRDRLRSSRRSHRRAPRLAWRPSDRSSEPAWTSRNATTRSLRPRWGGCGSGARFATGRARSDAGWIWPRGG